MLRMAPKLQADAPHLPAQELAEICVAAGRVKFYDATLLDMVALQLSKRLSGGRCEGVIAAQQLVDVLASFAGLNAYNRELFAAAARALVADGAASYLEASQLKVLVDSFKSVKHTDDAAYEALSQWERHARYEAAKEDIVRAELKRRWAR